MAQNPWQKTKRRACRQKYVLRGTFVTILRRFGSSCALLLVNCWILHARVSSLLISFVRRRSSQPGPVLAPLSLSRLPTLFVCITLSLFISWLYLLSSHVCSAYCAALRTHPYLVPRAFFRVCGKGRGHHLCMSALVRCTRTHLFCIFSRSHLIPRCLIRSSVLRLFAVIMHHNIFLNTWFLFAVGVSCMPYHHHLSFLLVTHLLPNIRQLTCLNLFPSLDLSCAHASSICFLHTFAHVFAHTVLGSCILHGPFACKTC